MTSTVVCSYCTNPAELVDGSIIYPSRPDLANLRFWRCAGCQAHVGCHLHGATASVLGKKKISDGTLPLGRLANAELRAAKQQAHAAFDPLWNTNANRYSARRRAYKWLETKLGLKGDACHIGEFNVEQCRLVVQACQQACQGAAI